MRVGATVQRVKDPEQAAVVARIFALYASGEGDRAIRDILNKEQVPAPRAPALWSETTVRDMLANETYRGVLVWGRTKSETKKGRERMVARPESEWIRLDAPELRIVPDDLWERANARRLRRREVYRRSPLGRLSGRTTDADRKGLLLSGLLRCGLCGGTLWAESKVRGSKKNKAAQRLVRWWGCSTNIARGSSACANGIRLLDQWMEHRVLEAMKRALDPSDLAETLRTALASAREAAGDRKVICARLEKEQTEAEQREQNLTKAIAAGGELDALVAALKAAQARRREIQAELEQGGGSYDEDATLEQARVRARVVLEFLDLGVRTPARTAAARSMLRAHLPEPLTCWPEAAGKRTGFRFEGPVALGGLLTGTTLSAGVVGASRWDCPSRPA